ncbi:MAG: uracil-DNA glycosylase [Chloroflexota bacterium]|nr:uracil-DNA glycosylase [Chloroflexota bacterium]
MTDAGRGAALEAIAAEIAVCTRCRLHEKRARTVPGEGNPETEVVVVGEGPGRDENQAGRPFVGASGRLLTELIESVGWRREDVFITNVVKCWPPGNRDPQPDEIAACAPFLRRQLEVLDPAVVVTAGKHSLNVFMPGERIGRVHGTSRPTDPATGAHAALTFAMYHPAFALYDGSNRGTLLDDIAGLPGTLEAARRGRAGGEAGSAAEPPRMAEPTDPEAPIAEPRIVVEPHQIPEARTVEPPPATSPPAPAPSPASNGQRIGLPGHAPEPDADQLTLF